jgi:hypothetical protein
MLKVKSFEWGRAAPVLGLDFPLGKSGAKPLVMHYLSPNKILKLNKKFLFKDGLVAPKNSIYKLKLFGTWRDFGMNSRSSSQFFIWNAIFSTGHFTVRFEAFSNLFNISFLMKLFLAFSMSQRSVVVLMIVMYLPGAIGLLTPLIKLNLKNKKVLDQKPSE